MIEIDRHCVSFFNQFVPCLSFKQGKFLILPEENSKISMGTIDLKERRAKISDFEDKSRLAHSILLCFALFLENAGRIILHASAAFKNGSGCLFPGPANAGKSTILKQLQDFSPLAEEWVAVKKEKNDFSCGAFRIKTLQVKRKKFKKSFFRKRERLSYPKDSNRITQRKDSWLTACSLRCTQKPSKESWRKQ